MKIPVSKPLTYFIWHLLFLLKKKDDGKKAKLWCIFEYQLCRNLVNFVSYYFIFLVFPLQSGISSSLLQCAVTSQLLKRNFAERGLIINRRWKEVPLLASGEVPWKAMSLQVRYVSWKSDDFLVALQHVTWKLPVFSFHAISPQTFLELMWKTKYLIRTPWFLTTDVWNEVQTLLFINMTLAGEPQWTLDWSSVKQGALFNLNSQCGWTLPRLNHMADLSTLHLGRTFKILSPKAMCHTQLVQILSVAV